MLEVREIYNTFQTPENLQQHMLRVGALAKIVTANCCGEQIDSEAIMQTCLLHDIAKPVTFDLSKQVEFGMSEKDIAELAELQHTIKTNYGVEEHDAAVAIFKEIGCSAKAIEIIADFEWWYLPRLLSEGKTEALITMYCDMRISPNGLLSIEDRLSELRSRRDDTGWMNDAPDAVPTLMKMVDQSTNINLDTINPEEVEKLASELRSFTIK